MACFIRPHGGSWKVAAPHHFHALKTYMELYVSKVEPGQMPPKGLILARRSDGDIFIGTFYRMSEYHYMFEENKCYTDITLHPVIVSRGY
jgi:hypothetical protein